MKTKKSIWSIALSLIIAFALVFGITLVNQPKSVKADVTYDGYITFDVKVDTKSSISVPAGYSGAITVTYTVTETTGVDALQLRLGYDHTAFTLDSVSTIDDDQESTSFALGHATHGAEGYLENIVFENVNSNGTAYVLDEEDEDDLIITAVFYLNQPTPARAYTFSLYNVNDEEEDELGSYSTAWKIKSNAQNQNDPAKLNPVRIQFANEANGAIVYVRDQFTDFTLTGGSKTYDGVAVPNSAITITYGDNTPEGMRPAISAENVVWFTYNEALWQQQNVSRYIKLDSNPVAAGTYYAVVKFDGNNFYNSYQGYTADTLYGDYGLDIGVGKVATYTITKKSITIKADNQNAVYTGSEPTVDQTAYTVTGATINSGVTITKVAGVNAGNYTLTPSYTNDNYTVTLENGTFTITAKNVTVVIADKSSVYRAPLAQLTYTIDANTSVVGSDDLGISLETEATSSSNVGTYDITGSATNGNYNVTFRNTSNTSTKGTYTITSQNIASLNYFSGDSVTFDAQSHDLLIVDSGKPNWVSHTAENNNQTNANTYTIRITVTIGTQDALNYLSSDLLEQLEQTENGYKYVTTVEGKINPLAVIVTADNKSHVYGNTPATLTPVTVGVNNAKVTVNFVVKNANEETITLSTETPVGTYTIVPSATNSNYSFTFNTGTYTVTEETATISISAQDIIYSREVDYTVSNAKVGTLDAPYTVEIRNSNNQVVTGVLPVGDYTIIATVAGTDNYNGATAQATFTVSPNVVGKPIVDLEQEIEEIHFDKDTVTWDAVTKDIFGNDLYNTTVTYRIGGVEYNNRSFTATSAGSYVIEILSSNENYLSNQVTLTVYSVTFTEGSHPASSNAEVEGLPATQYRFEGETATQPEGTPTVAGYTFNGWDFDFETEIEENTEIPALWTITQRTITVKVMHSGSEYSGTFTTDYNSAIDTTKSINQQGSLVVRANIAGMIDTHYDKDGMHYTFANSWNYKVTGSEAEYAAAPASVNATENYTFIAVYNATPIVYEITYNFSIDGAQYTESIIENDQYTSAAYGSTINYITPNSQKWFRVEAWYLDEERTQAAPTTMPAHDIEVYGALVFNVGKGDVNGDGNVDANDITLYRQWIVGGYQITALLNNDDLYEASELETEDPTDTVYFIARVADTNAATYEAEVLGDGSKDIRDVSTIRMGLVGGYGFSIVEGVDVTGEDLIIVREFEVESANDLLALARSGAKVTLSEDITDATLDAEILDSNKDIIIDLNGHTLTLKSFRVTLAQGNTGKILVTNGRVNVSDGNGVYLTAVDGSVHLDDVTLYDDNGLFVIQTADHSLHLFNVVRFLKKEIVNNEPVEVAAEVKIEKDSHVVIEKNAELVLEKVVVTDNFVPAEDESEAEITIDIKENTTIKVDPEGEAIDELPVEGNKFSYEIATISDLVAAMNNGGSYKLVANLSYTASASFNKDTTINLNGYTLRSTNSNAINALDGATVTLNGNGNVMAQEACVMAFDGSAIVINGGTYTSVDNFVVGTNGTPGRGNNTITINDGTFNGGITSAGYVACGIYVANNDTVVVDGGTFNITNGVGIVARAGNTTVNNGVEFNVTGNETTGKVGDSRVVIPSGKELVIDYVANYPGGTPVLTNNTNYEVYALVENVTGLQTALSTADNVVLGADIQPETAVAINTDLTVYGNGHKLKAEISGNGTVTFNNVYTTNISVKQSGFSGTLIFNGGVLDTDRLGTDDTDAAFYSSRNKNATFEFHNMSISANITKGIKIFNAANVVIDGCEFDATKLQIMQGETNSNIQSLSLVDIQIDNVEANITIKDSKFIGAPRGSIAVPESVYGFGTLADSDTGAAIKLKVEKGAQFGNVVITGNTFKDNYRDVIVGTAPYVNQLQKAANIASNGRSGDGLQYNTIDNWTISNNTTNLTAEVVENRGVATLSYIGGATPFDKYTTKVGNVGEIEGGVAIWTITNAFEKVDGVWYYVENGNKYAVSEVNGKAVLTRAATTLDELYYALLEGGNIQLCADLVYSGSFAAYENTTINLNNHKLESVDNVAIWACSGAALTFEGEGDVVAESACVVAYAGATVVINGGTFTSKDNFVVGTNGSTGYGENTIIINGGVFNGYIETEGYVACGIYVANNDTVNVNGGTFNITNGVGILARSGNTTVGENVVFNVTGNGTNGKVGDSRVVIPSGEVLVIDYAANYPGGEPTLTNNSSYIVKQIITGTGEGGSGFQPGPAAF